MLLRFGCGLQRTLRGCAPRCARFRSTLSALCAAQGAFKEGKKIKENDAMLLASYMSLPFSIDEDIVDVVRNQFSTYIQQDEIHKQLVQSTQFRIAGTSLSSAPLPLLLVSFDLRNRTFSFFNVATNTVAMSWKEADDAWGLAECLLQQTKAQPQVVLLPIYDSERERRAVQGHLPALSAALKQVGLLTVSFVDNLDLLEAFQGTPCTPQSLFEGISSSSTRVALPDGSDAAETEQSPKKKGKRRGSAEAAPPALVGVTSSATLQPHTQEWFQSQWSLLRTLACKAFPYDDALNCVMRFIAPKDDVFVIHLVRAGSRGVNIVLWDPVNKRRYAAKGMLSDVLACLLDRQTKHFILIPTTRTDRTLLLSCRTALIKSHRHCTLVFASEIGSNYVRVFKSDPYFYWNGLREASKQLDADLLFQVYQTAALNNRKALAYTREKRDALSAATIVAAAQGEKGESSLEGNEDSAEADDCEDGDAGTMEEPITSTSVDNWLSIFSNPKRRRREQLELRKYKRWLAVAYVATDYPAFTRPANPTVRTNYIAAASLADEKGNLVEPLAVYTTRGDFTMPALAEFDVIAVHDAKRFLLLMWQDAEIHTFLKRGGLIWCTMLAEYLLDAQRCCTGNNSLVDVAYGYGTSLPQIHKIGTSVEKLSLAAHRSYLIPAVRAVTTIFNGQLTRALDQCQLVSIAHRMDSMLAMTSMENAGVQIDAAEAKVQSAVVRNRTGAVNRALELYIPEAIPLDMRRYFDWASQTHVFAALFGGTIQLGGLEAVQQSEEWVRNVIYLCHRYGNLTVLSGSALLKHFAVRCGITSSTNRLVQNVVRYLDTENEKHAATMEGSQTRKKRKGAEKGSSQEMGEEEGSDYFAPSCVAATQFRTVVFDIESTGLNLATDEIIEIAMWDPVENVSFSSLVNPERPIQPATVNIHHITDQMVKHAPKMGEVAKSLAQFLRLDRETRRPGEVLVLVAHNAFSLDEPLLRRALNKVQPPIDTSGILFCDTLTLLKTVRSELFTAKVKDKNTKVIYDAIQPSMRLSTLAESLKIDVGKAALHRADVDTRVLWEVLVRVLGVSKASVSEQRDAVFAAAVRSFDVSSVDNCLVQSANRRKTVLQMYLPGLQSSALNSKLVRLVRQKGINEGTLEVLRGSGVKVADLLLEKIHLERHTARFLNTDDNDALSVVHGDSRVRQSIDMTSTTTSRTTSAFPSCQNIPKDDKSPVRRLFVSRFGADGRCVEIDYSQLEIVVLAILCEDENLVKDLNRGVDFHIRRAEFFSGIPYDEIYSGYKRGDPKYVRLRKTAKTFSFQRLYGAGVALLHKTTGIPVKDLEASIKAEDKAYPGIARFHRLIRGVALRPNNPGLPTHFISELPTGTRMSYKTRDVVYNLPPLKNYPIQGYGAELAQMMVGRLFRHFVRRDFYNKKAFVTNFVHDSVWLDCHVDVVEECAKDTAAILSDVHRYVPEHFPGVEIPVPLKVSVQCGMNMFTTIPVEDDYSAVRKMTKKSTLSEAAQDSSLSFYGSVRGRDDSNPVREEQEASDKKTGGRRSKSKSRSTSAAGSKRGSSTSLSTTDPASKGKSFLV